MKISDEKAMRLKRNEKIFWLFIAWEVAAVVAGGTRVERIAHLAEVAQEGTLGPSGVAWVPSAAAQWGSPLAVAAAGAHVQASLGVAGPSAGVAGPSAGVAGPSAGVAEPSAGVVRVAGGSSHPLGEPS